MPLFARKQFRYSIFFINGLGFDYFHFNYASVEYLNYFKDVPNLASPSSSKPTIYLAIDHHGVNFSYS